MWKDRKEIYAEIERLQQQLENYVDDLRVRFNYRFENGKVYFDNTVRAFHRRYKVHLLRYVAGARFWHIVTAPVIYGMIVPLVVFDLSLTLYQHICFRAYRIARVRRRDYIVVDRHRLGYLNMLEKFNCVYCSYGNGLIAYAREILSRTEQYWCPIKHAARVKDAHKRYVRFIDYGDAEGYRERLDALRNDLAKHKDAP